MKLWDKLLVLFAILACIGDIVSTFIGLSFYNLTETNPLGVWIPLAIKIFTVLILSTFLHLLENSSKTWAEKIGMNKWSIRLGLIFFFAINLFTFITNVFLILSR